MTMKQLLSLFLLVFLLPATAQELITYDVPDEMRYTAHNDDFTVRVRVPGGAWKDVYEYAVNVNMDQVTPASVVSFDFTGKVEVWVTCNNGLIHTARLRPLSYGLTPQVVGNSLRFSLDRPRKLSLEINGDKHRNLHLFANALRHDKPDPTDPAVIYFGPGVHTPGDQPGDVFHIPSNKTVYLDGGAVLKGKLMIDGAHDVAILGNGIVYQPERGVEIRHSQRITIDGPLFINPDHYTVYGGGSSQLILRNIKSFACKPWTDGIDLMACSDVLVEDVFLRTSDDCIALYGHRWDFYGNTRSIQVLNSTLWADVAHPTNIGVHGNAAIGGDTIEQVVFSNIDILEHDEDTRIAQGCLSIAAGDNNLVRHITYENIRIDDFEEGMLFNFQVMLSKKYGLAPGRGISNVLIKNVTYNGLTANPSEIKGYAEDRIVKGVRIEGLTINGKKISDLSALPVNVGPFVDGVVVDN